MAPALVEGDVIVTKLHKKHPKNNEIWVFELTNNKIVKRVKKIQSVEIWFEGDNINHSWDSRHFGYIKTDQLVGQAKFVAFNVYKLGRFFVPLI